MGLVKRCWQAGNPFALRVTVSKKVLLETASIWPEISPGSPFSLLSSPSPSSRSRSGMSFPVGSRCWECARPSASCSLGMCHPNCLCLSPSPPSLSGRRIAIRRRTGGISPKDPLSGTSTPRRGWWKTDAVDGPWAGERGTAGDL